MHILNVFLFYSIFGNLFERIIMFLGHESYTSGFMGTIFTPIYGIAVLIILFVDTKLKLRNKFLKIIVQFLIYFVLLTCLELVGGVLIENIFNKIFWNYDNFRYNIGKYISLETSLIWGIMSIIILYIVHPLFKRIEKYIPKFITIGLSIVFIINLIYILVVKIA